jgi:hypothetical protein
MLYARCIRLLTVVVFASGELLLASLPAVATCGGEKDMSGESYDGVALAHQLGNGGKGRDWVINRSLDGCTGTYTYAEIQTTENYTFQTWQSSGWQESKVNGTKVWVGYRYAWFDGAEHCTPPSFSLPSATGGRYKLQFRNYYVLINNIPRYRSEIDYEDGNGFQDLGYCQSDNSTEYALAYTYGINSNTHITSSYELLQYKDGSSWQYWKTFICTWITGTDFKVDKISDYAFDVNAGTPSSCPP